MCNKFIKYLNSMNNASSNNENALAESQVLNDYYEKIHVEREIGNYLFDLLFENKKRAIILTGHAGDGKTSILIQILNRLGYFKEGKKPLKEYEELKDFLYVKDMSELNEEKQDKYLIKVLEAPIKGISSLLISNTGPIINTFKRLIEDREAAQEFELKLLSSIDSIVSKEIEVNIKGRVFKLITVNIANVDNSYFVEEIINKLTNEELWQDCKCETKEICPIYSNYIELKKNMKRITEFIKRLYIYLSENESRLTIRQMLAHITYALTGNLECEEIKKKNLDKKLLFVHSFANQFFGYNGIEIAKDSFNIKAIRELDKIKLDKKSIIDVDHKLFIKEDFSCFDKSIAKVLEYILNINTQSLSIYRKESILLRRAFRRYYILYSKLHDENFENLINSLFSDIFTDYYCLISKKPISINLRLKIEEIVFISLYKLFLGVFPNPKEDKFYLTLKKDYDSEQNVQLLLGEIDKDIIRLKTKEVELKFDKLIKKYIPVIQFKDVIFELNYQNLDYLNRIKEGQIFTSLNPNFTFGLTKLKTDLINKFRKNSDDVKILLIKNSGVEKVTLYIEDDIITAKR